MWIAALAGLAACVPVFCVIALRIWIARMERPLNPGEKPPHADHFSERC